MRKKIVKISLVAAITLLVVSVSYFGYREIEENRIQAENALVEMQGKLDSQKGTMDTQQAKIEELQGFKEEQRQVNEQVNQEDEQSKKEDCEARLKKAQDNLASTQQYLTEYQGVLKLAEDDKCKDCYSSCLKSYDCTKSGCKDNSNDEDFDKIKKQCKKNHEENIMFRKQDVAGQLEGIKKYEAQSQSIKNECSEYIN